MSDLDDKEDPEVHDLGDHEPGSYEPGLEVGGREVDPEAEAIDLGAPASGELSHTEERERLLAATVADAVARDYRYALMAAGPRTYTGWWKWGLSAVLLLAAVLISTVPPRWLAGPVHPVPTRADREHGLRVVLTLQSGQLSAHRLRSGTLPRSLDELGGSADGIRYVRSNSRSYQLVGTHPDGSRVVWDSSNPPPEREALAERWLVHPVFP